MFEVEVFRISKGSVLKGSHNAKTLSEAKSKAKKYYQGGKVSVFIRNQDGKRIVSMPRVFKESKKNCGDTGLSKRSIKKLGL